MKKPSNNSSHSLLIVILIILSCSLNCPEQNYIKQNYIKYNDLPTLSKKYTVAQIIQINDNFGEYIPSYNCQFMLNGDMLNSGQLTAGFKILKGMQIDTNIFVYNSILYMHEMFKYQRLFAYLRIKDISFTPHLYCQINVKDSLSNKELLKLNYKYSELQECLLLQWENCHLLDTYYD